jgi:hypothetical protein
MKAKICALALSLTALVFTSQAQESTTFGLRAGVGLNNLVGKDPMGDDLEDNKLKFGFHIGVNAEIPIAPEFYIQPGLLFAQKGGKDASDNDNEETYNLSYLEVPINFVYKPTLGTGKLILGVGPYVGFGIGGKIKPEEGDDVDVKFKSDLDASDLTANTAWFKRLDFGGNLLAGYEFTNKFSVQLNAQLGMANLIPKVEGEKPEEAKLKNIGFGVSFGYRF